MPTPVTPAVRPFRFQFSDQVISDMHQRIDLTRWPDQVNDADWSYGMERGYLQELVAYWRQQFDWRAAEARLNAFDQYLLDVDGLDIHFIHQRSPHPNATPLLMCHGWPGSIVEFLKVIPRLTEPERFGGRVEDAFHVVCPSLPGYGGSPAATAPGLHPGEVARRHARLMAALGYSSYLAQGGDWGSPITQLTAGSDAEHCQAIHVTIIAPIPPAGVADPMALVADHEKPWLETNARQVLEGNGYYHQQSTRPQTLAYALSDSPVGLCGWIAEKFHYWADCESNGQRDIRNAVSWDDLLTNISLYWHTNSIGSSIRLYKEYAAALAAGQIAMPYQVPVPVGVTVYQQEVYKTPRAWVERQCDLIYWHEAERGGHFAAMEQPQVFAEDLWRFKNRAIPR